MVFLSSSAKPKVSWDASLTNVLDYHYLPLERLHDTANFTLSAITALFTLQLQTSVTDYPGSGLNLIFTIIIST